MGIDNRNQHDMIRSMPGGVPGVRQLVADFHHRGVRILFPTMMWDQETREPGKSWPDASASRMAEIGVDGNKGDTQDGVPSAYAEAAERIGHTPSKFHFTPRAWLPPASDRVSCTTSLRKAKEADQRR
jgi:hypothetical protein